MGYLHYVKAATLMAAVFSVSLVHADELEDRVLKLERMVNARGLSQVEMQQQIDALTNDVRSLRGALEESNIDLTSELVGRCAQNGPGATGRVIYVADPGVCAETNPGSDLTKAVCSLDTAVMKATTDTVMKPKAPPMKTISPTPPRSDWVMPVATPIHAPSTVGSRLRASSQ